jgi:hypothetical protein
MLNPGTWTDRNKASSLLEAHLKVSNRDLIAKLRLHALDSLCEMALWDMEDSDAYREALAQIAGISEQERKALAVSELISAAKHSKSVDYSGFEKLQ